MYLLVNEKNKFFDTDRGVYSSIQCFGCALPQISFMTISLFEQHVNIHMYIHMLQQKMAMKINICTYRYILAICFDIHSHII